VQTGEAVWNATAIMHYLARKHSTDTAMLRLLGLGQESCKQIADHLGISLPTSAELNNYTQYFDNTFFPAGPKPGTSDRRQNAQGDPPPVKAAPPVEEALKVAGAILEGCSDLYSLPAACEFAESVANTTESMSHWIRENNHVTEKMFKSLKNIKAGVDKWLSKMGDRDRDDSRDYEGDYDEGIPF